MLPIYAAIVLALLLAGCATPDRWAQPGKTDEEANAALGECENQSAPKVTPAADPVYKLPNAHAVKDCMAAKGYRLVADQ